MRERRDCGNVGVENRGKAKKQNEPWKRNLGFAAFERRGRESQRNDPEGARQFYSCADDQSFRAVFGRGADDRTRVMNRERGPKAELRLRKMKRAANRRKNQ